VCCAGLPVLAAALAGVSIAAVAGVGLGGIVVIGLGAAALGVLRARRRTCEREEGQKGLTR
jgi:hypothetical protein